MTRCGRIVGGVQRPLNTVHVEHPFHTASLLYGLNSLRSKGLLLDVTLIAGSESFQAHRVVLAAFSEYFRAMFTDEMRERRQSEICLNGVTAAGLQSLLEYAYTSKLSLNLANVQDVLAAAAHVQVSTVVEACSNYLEDQLDLDNCVDIATIAETYCLHALQKKVYAFMCAHLFQFSKLPDFQRLTSSQLSHLLSCDFPVDLSEARVLQAAIDWLQYSWSNRAASAPRLLASINWPEVPKSMREKLHIYLQEITTLPRHVQTCGTVFNEYNANVVPPGLINSRGLELAIVKVGGFSISGITNEVTYFLPSVGKWRHLTTIPHVEQCNFGTSVLNNELYVVGGCFNQSLQENIHPFGFRYSPKQNKWSTMAPMQRERCRFSLTVVGNYLYAVGGATEEGGGVEGSCEVYDPGSDIWMSISSLPGPRAQHAATSLNSTTLLVTGGLEGEHVLSSCWVYCVSTARWEARASLILPRADHVCVNYKGKAYVCGGWFEDETTNSRVLVDTIDCYNPSFNSWTTVGRVPTPRYHSGIVVEGCILYIIGGFHSDATFDRATGVIECFDLETMKWSTDKSYPQDIWEHVCIPLYIPRYRDDMEVISLKR